MHIDLRKFSNSELAHMFSAGSLSDRVGAQVKYFWTELLDKWTDLHQHTMRSHCHRGGGNMTAIQQSAQTGQLSVTSLNTVGTRLWAENALDSVFTQRHKTIR